MTCDCDGCWACARHGKPTQRGRTLCRCGHPLNVHHRTESGNVTYCTVWDPDRCPCKRYVEAQ